MSEFPWPVHPVADIFPMLPEEELAELARDIEEHGLREPIWLYRHPLDGVEYLIDGRNRYLACQRVGEPVISRQYRADEDADDSDTSFLNFVISLNVKRRHLTTGQKAAVAYQSLPLFEAEGLKREEAALEAANRRRAAEAEEQRRRAAEIAAMSDDELSDDEEVDLAAEADLPQRPDQQLTAGQRAAVAHQGLSRFERENRERQSREPRAPQSRDLAGRATGASGRSVAQFKRVAEQAPDLAKKVHSGEIALDRAERIIRDREAEKRRIEQARREAAQSEIKTIADIRHGDFREVLADLRNVDAIITDPPYPFEFLPLLDDLGQWADKVLGPDGVMAVLIGQTYLPEVYRRLDGHRPYRWTGCYLTPGAGYVSWPRKVQSNWKPVIVYGGGPRFADVVRSEGTDANAKNLHSWGQDYGAFHTLIERLTERGQTVVDPFAGSGTTLLAAKALGRHAIGAEIDEDHVRTARERVA